MSSSEASLADVTSPHIRWGIIGCGAVCEVKSGPAFYKCENSSLVAVMCRNVEKARDFAERHNVRTHYGTVEELIQDPQVDCVYVATPPGGDRVSIAKAIVAHKKPCYMEKPLGRDGNEAEEIAKLFREASLPLYCGYYRRYMPKFRNVQECLPKIGLLTSVAVALTMPRHLEEKSHWHYDRSVSGGGILLDMGCHMLDLVDHLVGPIEDTHGISVQTISDQGWLEGKPRIEDNVRGYWKHILQGDSGRDYGVLGSCSFNFSGAELKDEIEIVGTKGKVLFSCFDSDPIQVFLDDEDHLVGAEHPDHAHQPLVQVIVNGLLDDQASSCVCTGDAAVRTSRVMDRLLNERSSWDADYV